MSDIYKQALRENLRFEFKGIRNVEELWFLSVNDLDSMFQELNSQRRVKSEESLLQTQSAETTELDLKIAIIRDIVETKLQEKVEKEDAVTRATQKQKVLEAIARKKDNALETMSLEELEQMVNAM